MELLLLLLLLNSLLLLLLGVFTFTFLKNRAKVHLDDSIIIKFDVV